MYKAILKSIFPRTFLKEAFLVFNKVKIGTLDKLLFPEQPINASEFEIFEELNPYLSLNIEEEHLLQDVKSGVKVWKDPTWKQDQYLIKYKNPAFIEPRVGWGVTYKTNLIYPSLGFSRATYVHKPSFIETYFKKPKVSRLGKIISLRDTGEENYFHFFNDVLAKIFFLKDRGIDLKEYTIVISKALFDKEYFQYYFQNTWFSDLKWHVQDSDWVYFKEAIFCKPFTHTKHYFDQAISLLPKPAKSKKERKVFLTRNKRTLRYIENIEEVSAFLVQEGYEVIDSASISFLEQVNLFYEARFVVAVHGAGITNIIFRRSQTMSLLEILPPFEYVPFHYIMLAKLFCYNYDAIIGENQVTVAGGIRVNMKQLKNRLAKNTVINQV